MGTPHAGPGVPGPSHAPLTEQDPPAVSGHRLTARLAVTALGRVYLAQAPGGRPVALTVVHPELAAREGFGALFHRDAQAAGRVRASFAVPVLGSGKEGERYWVAAAYAPALTLRAAVEGPAAGAGPLPTGVVLRLVDGLAEALAALHRAGVVHGDLRPGHVLLAPQGPRIKDYGFAGLPGFTPVAGDPPAFAAPEQVAGHPAAPATDVFALGQIAAYAAIGAPPFGDASARVRHDEPDLSELPGELREIVTRCLIKDPALRPSLAQVTAMCAQAAPSAARPGPWLPPHLLAPLPPPAAASAATPIASPSPAPPRPAQPPSGPVRGDGASDPAGAAAVEGPPAAGAASAAHPLPDAAGEDSGPRRPEGVAAVQQPAPPQPPVPAPSPQQNAPAPTPTPAPAPSLPPSSPPPAPGWGPPHRPHPWPRPAHLHLALPRPLPKQLPRRRGAGAAALLAGVVVAVAAGIALAGGFGGGGASGDAVRGKDVAGAGAGHSRPPAATGAPTTGGPPSGGPGTAPDAPLPQSPGPPGDPRPPTNVYRGIVLPAGSALSLQESPPVARPGPYSGAFGLDEGADAFVSDVRQGSLATLAPGLPPTLGSCLRAASRRSAVVPRGALTEGGGICVRAVDGTVALMTIRQLTAPGDPRPYATLDVAVWRASGGGA